jgi:hypothetical protein
VSVKNWYVGIHEKVLNVLITYWRYVPNKLIQLVHQSMIGFSLLLQWLPWERNWGETRGLVSWQAVDCVGGPFISGAVWSVQLYWFSVKGCHGRGPPIGSVRGLAWKAYVSCVPDFSLQGVHQFKSLWLSDMSNRLSCDYEHIVNYGMMVSGGLIELLYLNNCIAIFVWPSPGLPCLKYDELIYMIKIMKVRTYS